jgi:hypothetical protein
VITILDYKPKRILVIPDTQVKEGVNTDHLEWAGKYIVDKRPDIIVHLGDHWDFESLSSYDKGKLSFEGRRLVKDIEAGKEGMKRLLDPLRRLQASQKRYKKPIYNPRLVFCCGNHEERLARIPSDMPEFDGLLGYEILGLEEDGWEFHDYLKTVEIDGIFFTHFMANPFSGRPYGGSVMNVLKTVGRSFVVGHRQVLDVAIRPTIDGKMQIGIVAGAFYSHDEIYKTPQGNGHWRGLVLLNDVRDGYADACFVSLDYLSRRYGKA